MKLFDRFASASHARFGTALTLALLIGAASPAVAARSSHSKGDALSQASELAEQLSENAPTIDAAALAKSMAELDALKTRLSISLTPDRQKTFGAFLAGMRDAWTAKDRSTLAVQSIGVYRLLQDALPAWPRRRPCSSGAA